MTYAPTAGAEWTAADVERQAKLLRNQLRNHRTAAFTSTEPTFQREVMARLRALLATEET